MNYKILKDFKGSPNGSIVVQYTKGETVELTDSLAACVVPEGWAEEIKKEVKKTRKPRTKKEK